MLAPERDPSEALPLLKALGDDTRFRCFRYVRDAGRAVSVAEVATELGLHQNTVRPHLERLREVGLLEVTSDSRGTVGRPQHLYQTVTDAPSLGLGPRSYHLLAELLAGLASRIARPDDAVEIGQEWGAYLGVRESPRPGSLGQSGMALLETTFDRLGFDPVVDGDTLCFTNCPFRELAEAYPDLICSLHRGLCEGLIDISGDSTRIEAFHPLHSPEPCSVVLARR